jgi:hypothetical protein
MKTNGNGDLSANKSPWSDVLILKYKRKFGLEIIK